MPNTRFSVFRRILTCLVFSLCLYGIAQAGFDEGLQAAQAGDYGTALREFKPLAEMGNADAQYNLGVMYYQGNGIPKNDIKAARWTRKAAEQGYTEAQYNLGVMYSKGMGVAKNDVLAYMLFNLAIAGSFEFAIKTRNLLATNITPKQIAEAEALAAIWIVGTPLPTETKTWVPLTKKEKQSFHSSRSQ